MSKTTTILKRLGVAVLWGMVLTGFTVLLVAAIQDKDAGKCKSIQVKFEGKDDNFFIESKDIKSLITKDKNLNPVGKSIADINIAQLESIVDQDPWVKNAEIYFDNGQQLNIKVTQREPVARVFTFSGNSFYLDGAGEHIPVSSRYAARVPVFTGFPSDAEKLQQPDSLLAAQIVDMGTYIGKDPFWMAQVEQLMITGDRRFEFIPKLGDQVIAFGEGIDIEKKFTKLLAFYKEGLNKVGWNNYTRINIAFENEVVCTRKDGVVPLQPVIKTDSLKLADADEPPIADSEDSTTVAPVVAKPVHSEPAKPVTKPAHAAKEKAKPQKAKVKKEKAAAPAKQQPKAVYKPGNKSVNTSKKQKTP
ncbi:cell division protein FtsQ/DivIB [Chitinophaga sp. RCC_12]|uniref:cell division protein FtsQ/DivIB n=1 Tax=Chitinophaga sp. RCC_12 TaxID=3239226 RepID=UPI00352427FB